KNGAAFPMPGQCASGPYLLPCRANSQLPPDFYFQKNATTPLAGPFRRVAPGLHQAAATIVPISDRAQSLEFQIAYGPPAHAGGGARRHAFVPWPQTAWF